MCQSCRNACFSCRYDRYNYCLLLQIPPGLPPLRVTYMSETGLVPVQGNRTHTATPCAESAFTAHDISELIRDACTMPQVTQNVATSTPRISGCNASRLQPCSTRNGTSRALCLSSIALQATTHYTRQPTQHYCGLRAGSQVGRGAWQVHACHDRPRCSRPQRRRARPWLARPVAALACDGRGREARARQLHGRVHGPGAARRSAPVSC